MNPAENAHGPMMLGLLFNAILYGILTTQVYLYYTSYPDDKLWLKYFVLLVFIGDTANLIFDFVYLYNVLVLHFGDIPYLLNADWVFATDPALTAVLACMTQVFFAHRIRILTKTWYLPTIVVLLSFTGLVGGFATAVYVGITPDFRQFQDFKAVVIVWLVSSCVCDIAISSILVFFLVGHIAKRCKTGFKASDALVDRIISLTVQTGLITTFCATVDLISYLKISSGIHLIFNFVLSKLYTNSLMSSLNSREVDRGNSNGSSGLRVSSLTEKRSSMVPPQRASQYLCPPSPLASHASEVLVTTQSEQFRDGDVSTIASHTIPAKFDDGESSRRPSTVVWRDGDPVEQKAFEAA